MQHPGSGWHRTRAAVLGVVALLVTLAAAAGVWGGFLHELHRLERRGAIRTLDALPVLLWAALLLALLWAAVLIAMATASVARGGRGGGEADAGRGAGPRGGGVVPRLAGVLLAVTALSSLTATAPAFAATTSTTAVTATQLGHAAPGGIHAAGVKSAGDAKDSCPDAPTPGWVPDKPSRTEQVARECAPLITGKPVADTSGEVVVRRGDTLWSIAAAHLGPHADAHAIAEEWPRWYAANKDVIGDDPDLLMIGIRLQTPHPVMEGSSR